MDFQRLLQALRGLKRQSSGRLRRSDAVVIALSAQDLRRDIGRG